MTQHPHHGAASPRIFAVPHSSGEASARVDQPLPPPFESSHQVLSGSNPLIAAANPLLNLIYQIRTLVHNSELARMREYLIQQVKDFEARARSQGILPDEVMAARYCLCTVLDETAAQTPWGGSGAWSKHSLLVAFHNETWGGEKFFQLLAKLSQSAAQHINLLELMYYCISLGFEGRYKVVNNGRSQLESLRARLAEIIRSNRKEHARALSANWQPTEAAAPRIWSVVPVWVSLLFALVIGLILFILLSFSLADRSDQTFSSINQLPLLETPERPARASIAPRLSGFLQEEIRAGLVSVDETAEYSRVIILGDGLYDSGSASVRPRYVPVLQRIGSALEATQGKVVVAGHSDNIPIRTLRFPSNWHLSLERAHAVAARLSEHLSDAGRLSTVGMADSEPVAPNDSAQARALNRRVEITLFATPSAPTPGIK